MRRKGAKMRMGLANTWQKRFVSFRFLALPCAQPLSGSEPLSPSQNTFSEGADGGTRTHTSISRKRILSPLRLPFRHIGGCGATLAHGVRRPRGFGGNAQLRLVIPSRARRRGTSQSQRKSHESAFALPRGSA